MDECRLIRGGAGFHGKQGLDYFAGVSAESAGSRAICMHQVMRVEEGDFLYIPAGVPHQPYNPTDTLARAVLARTDRNEQESVVVLDGRPA